MKKIFPVLILLSLLAACDHNSNQSEKDLSVNDLKLEEVPPSPKLPQRNVKDKTPADTSSGISQINVSNQDWDKKIIKTAYLKLEVENFKKYADILHKAARQYGGYVANEEQNQSEEKIEASVSIKVPLHQFESIMNDLSSGAVKTIDKKITTEDVTGEVFDTKSRLEAKRQIRLKYLDFLKQSKNMTEVLQVQNEINNIQEEIEAASGRINYLSHQSAYSTVNVTFYQPFAGYTPTDKPGFLIRVATAFKEGFNFIAELFIGLVSVWPLLLLIISGWIIWKKRIITASPARQKL